MPRGVGNWEEVSSEMASELLVRLMGPGRWTQLGITAQEARDLAYEYEPELKPAGGCYHKEQATVFPNFLTLAPQMTGDESMKSACSEHQGYFSDQRRQHQVHRSACRRDLDRSQSGFNPVPRIRGDVMDTDRNGANE
jgi:hypothetical protein